MPRQIWHRRANGNTGEVEGLHDVRSHKLVGKREAHQVKGGQRGRRLEGKQRHVTLAHEVCHVMPGQIAALAGDAIGAVEGVVKNRYAQVGLADLIGVGIDETRMEGARLLLDGAPLVIEVARGLLDKRQQGLDEPEEVLSC